MLTSFLIKVRHAFDVMGLAPEQVADVFMVLSGILHLGNVTFVSAAGAQIAEKPGTLLPSLPPSLPPLHLFHSLSVPLSLSSIYSSLTSSLPPSSPLCPSLPPSIHHSLPLLPPLLPHSTLYVLPPVLDATADLLSLDPFRLGDALTQKYMVLRGEEITTPLTVQQVTG